LQKLGHTKIRTDTDLKIIINVGSSKQLYRMHDAARSFDILETNWTPYI